MGSYETSLSLVGWSDKWKDGQTLQSCEQSDAPLGQAPVSLFVSSPPEGSMNIWKFQKIMANPGRYENVGHKMHHHYITIKKVIVTIHNAMPECFSPFLPLMLVFGWTCLQKPQFNVFLQSWNEGEPAAVVKGRLFQSALKSCWN